MSYEGLKIRDDVLKKITSAEADKVTPQLPKIYVSLASAPPQFWERENVMRFTDKLEGQAVTTAWEQLATLVKASPRVTRKALKWLEDQGLVTLSISHERREIVISVEGFVR